MANSSNTTADTTADAVYRSHMTDISKYTAGTGNVVMIRIIIFILGRGEPPSQTPPHCGF